MERLKQYSYLWNGSEEGWVLLELEPDSLCIVNEITGILLHIESDELNQELCKRLRELGTKTITEMPIVDLNIEEID